MFEPSFHKPPCDLTENDAHIWAQVVLNASGMSRLGSMLWTCSLMQDDRDARIMHTRSHRRAFGCGVCWEFVAHPGCTVDHEIRCRRPFPQNSLGALLQEYLR